MINKKKRRVFAFTGALVAAISASIILDDLKDTEDTYEIEYVEPFKEIEDKSWYSVERFGSKNDYASVNLNDMLIKKFKLDNTLNDNENYLSLFNTLQNIFTNETIYTKVDNYGHDIVVFYILDNNEFVKVGSLGMSNGERKLLSLTYNYVNELGYLEEDNYMLSLKDNNETNYYSINRKINNLNNKDRLFISTMNDEQNNDICYSKEGYDSLTVGVDKSRGNYYLSLLINEKPKLFTITESEFNYFSSKINECYLNGNYSDFINVTYNDILDKLKTIETIDPIEYINLLGLINEYSSPNVSLSLHM